MFFLRNYVLLDYVTALEIVSIKNSYVVIDNNYKKIINDN